MNTETLASLRIRTPFRPFARRVNSGSLSSCEKPEQFGATGDLQVIIHFTENRFSLIHALRLTEVIENTPANG